VIEGITSTRERKIFLWASALFTLAILVVARQVLLPFILALVVAYVFTPAVKRAEKARLPRWAAILIVYAISLGMISGFIAVVVPRLISEGQQLAAEWPRITKRANDEWLPTIDKKLAAWTGKRIEEVEDEPAPESTSHGRPPLRVVKGEDGSLEVHLDADLQFRQAREGVWTIGQAEEESGISTAAMLRSGLSKVTVYLRENSVEVLKIGREVVAAISYSIFVLFMTLMLAGYIMLTHEKIIAFFRELFLPASRPSFDRFMRRLDRGLSGVLRGQLMICLVNGVLSAIGFWLFGLKYWPILAIVAGGMSLIPIFGSILSSIPAVAIGLTQSPATAIGVLAWIIGIHQIEANFLNPKIIGDAAKIHPVLVVFSLIAGEHLFQLKGALFAVPCLSIAQTIFLHFRETTMGLADPSASIPPGVVQVSRISLKTPISIPATAVEAPKADEPERQSAPANDPASPS